MLYYSFFHLFQFMNFLDRLARALNMDEISNDVGVDLHTESLLVRAEQLARLESDKLVDKVSSLRDEFFCFMLIRFGCAQLLCCGYGTLPRLRRERSFHDPPLREVRRHHFFFIFLVLFVSLQPVACS